MNGPQVTGLSLRYVVTIDAIEAEHPVRIAARVALAPDMETLLREPPWGCETASEADTECEAPLDGESPPCWEHRLRALLARIDATGKAGT